MAQSSRQRGAALTGYALALAAMVVASLGALAALERTSEDYLEGTSEAIGQPREPRFVDPPDALAFLPPDSPNSLGGGVATTTTAPTTTTTTTTTATSTTTVDPNVPTEFAMGAKSAAPTPDKLDGDIIGIGPYPPGADLSWDGADYDDDEFFYFFEEGRVVLDSAWVVPGSSPSVTLAAGEAVCGYYVHYSPVSGTDVEPDKVKIEFDFPVVGFVGTDVGLSQTDNWMGGELPPSAPAQWDEGRRGLESNDEVKIKKAGGIDDAKVELDKFETTFNYSDDIRIFTRC
jgi:hypothetical protein